MKKVPSGGAAHFILAIMRKRFVAMEETGRELASIADLFARRPRFRAGRGRVADHG